MDVAKSELRQFLTRATKNAQCANSARIPYRGFSQIRSHIESSTPGYHSLDQQHKEDVENNEGDDDSREKDWLRAKMQAHLHTLERPSAETTRTHKTKCKWLLTGLAQRWVTKLHRICTIRYK